MLELIKKTIITKEVNKFVPGKPSIPTLRSPLDAPDSDYLHWIDFSVASRFEFSGDRFVKLWVEKAGALGRIGSYYVNAAPAEPENTGLINGLVAADYNGATERGNYLLPACPADLKFMYPGMTVFILLQPRISVTQIGAVISDYGDVGNKEVHLRVGSGAALQVDAQMRDGAANIIAANSGGTVLSLNTDYLLVCRFDGANRTLTFWIDGVAPFTATNPAYDPTTTWEGAFIANAEPTLGLLSTIAMPFQGYIASLFNRLKSSGNGIVILLSLIY